MSQLEQMMSAMNSKQRTDLILKLIASQAEQMCPHNFKGFVTGAILANLVWQMTDEQFQDFCKVMPCDEPGCNCVKVSQSATDFFKFLRSDFVKEIARRKVSRN